MDNTVEQNAIPDANEIDALLALYLDAEKNVEDAIAKREVFGEQIEELIAIHGSLPPRAKKSKRIKGEEYQATLSQSHSVEVDAPSVERLHELMKSIGLARWFRKLFRREEVFVLNDGAQGLIDKLALKTPGSPLALVFAKTLRIESRSPRLEVEPIKKEKKEARAA